ncbi:hypothetical protein B4135_4189 [Caldibacillus debilis]|uniref:Uncharacterized protein n=1 Tax=Caldibacillus debilis TaxID=301148 RepID=A0A150L8J6_9BACI|nr:hypothetical protein B4135_4189 [Caldibacillus debilis]
MPGGGGPGQPRPQAWSKCGQQKIILRLKIRKITPGGEERPARTAKAPKICARFGNPRGQTPRAGGNG